MKVLICDDSFFMRKILGESVKRNVPGAEIAGEAKNGGEAVEQYIKLHPDAVTMDITMPEHDGIWAVKQIMSADPEAKIVMVSAMGQKWLVLDALKNGAKDFVVKPFTDKSIQEAFDKIRENP